MNKLTIDSVVLKDKKVLVIGESSGIGGEIARQYIAAGGTVCAASHAQNSLIRYLVLSTLCKTRVNIDDERSVATYGDSSNPAGAIVILSFSPRPINRISWVDFCCLSGYICQPRKGGQR